MMVVDDHSKTAFLALFPHRYDYIWSEHGDGNSRAEWKTESRHPLSDRVIQQGAYLYGVRFGASTDYCLLDVDLASPYHPRQDPFAIARMVTALAPLGLVRYLACTSSYSGGLHVYFPFAQAQSSWKLAIAVAALLESAGFKLKPGQLELFPDPKPYNVNGKPSLFNAHRLPLQIGSYLVDQDFQPVWSTHQRFVQQWQLVQVSNDVQASLLKQVLKRVKRQRYAISNKAEKFINDLNAEIELGWTDFGQTNYLLGRIVMREYIFRHVLSGGVPLEGKDLVTAVVSVAQELPGYSEYCRHRHEIEHRASEWARCIENSRYFHYGDASGKFNAKTLSKVIETDASHQRLAIAADQSPTWNHQQSAEARDRIKRAIAALLEQGTLPPTVTARFRALVQYGIGGSTLYRHRDLWHPSCWKPTEQLIDQFAHDSVPPVENPPNPPTIKMDGGRNCLPASPPPCPPSLFPGVGGNQPGDAGFGDRAQQNFASGRNDSGGQGMERPIRVGQTGGNWVIPTLIQSPNNGQATSGMVQATHQEQQRRKREAAVARLTARMREFMESGDPILMAEAIAWARLNV